MERLNDTKIESDIIALYTEGNKGVRATARAVSKSQAYVTRILQEKGLYKFADECISKIGERKFIPANGHKFIAKHKITSKEFNDFENKSGILTRYIAKINPEVELPAYSYEITSYYAKYGSFWYEKYFDIVEIPDPEFGTVYKKCSYCEWKTIDLINKSGQYVIHLEREHNKSIKDYILEFPNETYYFPKYIKEKETEKFLDLPENYIKCMICGEKMMKITNSHLKHKHSISLEEYRLKYSNTLSETSMKTVKEIYKKGLGMVPSSYNSIDQNEIQEFLESLGIQCNPLPDREILDGLEIDILSEDKKIGIEYNGIIYHSELYGKKNNLYHLNKTNLALKKGYKLIHIFEDELLFREYSLKEKLKHIFEVTNGNKIINNKNCEIKIISTGIKEDFLKSNHIQGNLESDINIGAFFNEDLVSVMTFNKNETECNFELGRFSVRNGINLQGISKILLDYFIKNHSPNKITGFADRCWIPGSENNFYTKLGFTLIETLQPDYKYFNRNKHSSPQIDKSIFNVEFIKKRFPEIYDESKTEWQMMQEAGFDRVWDCGKFKYELDLTGQNNNV